MDESIFVCGHLSGHPPLAGSLSRRRRGSLPGSRGEPLSWRPRGPGSPQLCSVSGAQGRGHSPYTPARKSKTNADLHRGDSFVLQRLAITTADGVSEEEMEEEEELGPDAAATEPPAAPCALRGGGRGGAAAAAAARPPALPPSGPPSAACQLPPRAAREPYAGRLSRRQGQVERTRARGEGVAEARLRPRTAQASRRRHPPDGARAGTRAHPCARQSPGPPALVPAPRSAGLSQSWGRFPRDWSPKSKAVPIDERARERRPRGSRELGRGAPQRSSAAVRGLLVTPAGGVRTSWEAEGGCACGESG